MLEHEEFHNHFEMADVLSEREYDPDKEANPFLHITMRAIAETQLENREPMEVYQFYNPMRKKKASHHDAVHLIGVVLAPLIWKTLREQRAFDLEEYRSCFKKVKYMKKDKDAQNIHGARQYGSVCSKTLRGFLIVIRSIAASLTPRSESMERNRSGMNVNFQSGMCFSIVPSAKWSI